MINSTITASGTQAHFLYGIVERRQSQITIHFHYSYQQRI